MRSAAELVEFATRDRAAVDEGKQRYWAEWKRVHGPAGGIAMAEELRRQARAARPNWPTDADRMADQRTHERVSALLRRVPDRRR